MKRLFSILLAVSMLMSFSVSVFADDTGTTSDPSETPTYDIQITSDIVIDEKIHSAYGNYPWSDYGKFDAVVAGKEFKGITLSELRSAVIEAYDDCGMTWNDDQYDNPWTVGSTHKVTIELNKWSDEAKKFIVMYGGDVNVTVQKTNIESIIAKPFTMYDGGFGKTDRHTAVVTYKDGSTEDVDFFCGGWEWPTEIGTYNVIGKVYGCIEVPVTINVVPLSSAADVQITSDIVIDEQIRNEYRNYAWEYFGKLDAIVAGKELKGITMKELESAFCEAYCDTYGDCYMSARDDDKDMTSWDVGSTHKGTVEFYAQPKDGQERKILFATSVNIKIQETNIESIIAKPITIYEGGLGRTDWHTAVITYKDGSTEDVDLYCGDIVWPKKIGTYIKYPVMFDCVEIAMTVNVVATFPDEDVEIKEGEDTVIDATEMAENAENIVIGAETIDKLEKNNTSVEIKFSDMVVSLDKDAIDSINEQAGESNVTIVAKKVEESILNDEQKAALEKTNVCAVLNVEAFAGETKITSFGGGKVTISIPFALPEGKEGKDFCVAYVADDGTVTAMPTTYADGKLTFETTHFSNYVVVEKSAEGTGPDVSQPDDTSSDVSQTDDTSSGVSQPDDTSSDVPSTGDSSYVMLLAVLILAGAAGLALCTKRRAF